MKRKEGENTVKQENKKSFTQFKHSRKQKNLKIKIEWGHFKFEMPQKKRDEGKLLNYFGAK